MARNSLIVLASLLCACVVGGSDEDRTPQPTNVDPKGQGHVPTPKSAYNAIDACEGAPEVVFPAAICVCDTFTMSGNFEARGFGGGAGATVGVNGNAVFQSNTEIDGTLHAHGGLDAGGNGSVGQDILSTGSVTWRGNLEVRGDLNAGGDLEGIGNLQVGGDLRLGGGDRTSGNVEIGGYGPYVRPAEPPCPCDPSTYLDIAAVVAAAATDPAIAALSTMLEGNTSLRLNTGAYYARDATWIGNLDVVIDGHVDLFIEDSISTLGNGEFELTLGSTLDIYVAGSMQTVGNAWVGGGVPGAVRIYVGGSEGMVLQTGNTTFVASVYAPEAEVAYEGNTEILGAIFARSLSIRGNFKIAYPGLLDPPAPQRCPPPDEGDDSGNDSATTGAPEPPGTSSSGTGGDTGPMRDTDDESGTTTGDAETAGPGESGTTGGAETTGPDEPDTTGGEACPEIENDCYLLEDKFVCMETPDCKWKHGPESCTWQSCGGLDPTICGLDPSCEWNECQSACYPK